MYIGFFHVLEQSLRKTLFPQGETRFDRCTKNLYSRPRMDFLVVRGRRFPFLFLFVENIWRDRESNPDLGSHNPKYYHYTISPLMHTEKFRIKTQKVSPGIDTERR